MPGYVLMWTVEWKIGQLQPPAKTTPLHRDMVYKPLYIYANYARYQKLGFNKNVIIIHFEEFIDLQRLHMLNGRDMLMMTMGMGMGMGMGT